MARRVLHDEYALTPKWLDDQSRDTAENAAQMAALMRRDGIRRIALVTDATHIPRASEAFRKAGFDVLPAPTDFPVPSERPLLQWLPSSNGALLCRQVLREWLARQVAQAS